MVISSDQGAVLTLCQDGFGLKTGCPAPLLEPMSTDGRAPLLVVMPMEGCEEVGPAGSASLLLTLTIRPAARGLSSMSENLRGSLRVGGRILQSPTRLAMRQTLGRFRAAW